jgi:5-methylcytosine-specific restriction endonuclease McrA
MTGIKLSLYEKSLHERALTLSHQHRRVESVLVTTLEEIDRLQFFRRLGYSSLFTYAVTALQLSEAAAYSFISVARKSREFPELKDSIANQKLTVAKAARIVSILSVENAGELIEFAGTHSTREIDRKVAVLRGALCGAAAGFAGGFAGVRGQLVSLKISRETKELLKRARDLLASKSSTQRLLPSKKGSQKTPASQKRGNLEMDQVLQLVLGEYLRLHDPVKKAQRALARRDGRGATALRRENSTRQEKSAQGITVIQAKNSVRTESAREAESPLRAADAIQAINSVGTECSAHSKGSEQTEKSVRATLITKRRRLLAHEKHAVFARDGGRCTFKDALGRQCESERWLHLHHIHPVSLGGGNQVSNITTLCSFHHDLVHQLSFPIEGQISWLREPERAYLN